MKKFKKRIHLKGVLSGLLILLIIGSVVVTGFGGNPFSQDKKDVVSEQSNSPNSPKETNKETDITILREDKTMLNNLKEWENIDKNLTLTESLNYQYTKDKKEAKSKIWKKTYSNAVDELKKSEENIHSYEKILSKKYSTELLEKLKITNDIYETKISATRFMYEAITENDNFKLEQVAVQLKKLNELTEKAESQIQNN